jgi:peptidoglycan/xylan/chitin deacetylase (PgdA/CDA1 family)
LTFDDGPDQEVTPAILDLLDRFDARAIFFIVGKRIERAPHLLREILRRGHAIGNHTDSHDTSLGFFEQLRDLKACQRKIQWLTGQSPWLLRPPAGKLNAPVLCAAWRLGLRIVLWSVDSGDWKLRTIRAARTRGRELADSFAEQSSYSEIMLLHDDNRNTVGLLEEFMPAVVESGCDLNSGVEDLVR